ncbi:MAG: hypothetical protein H0U18_14675 [Pyrinomonadaceae bacterium]|nr:hypothetical protein [Pyrinomonadaceae bacterium]
MTVAAGTKFGRYEIRSKIGAGGMGEVAAQGVDASAVTFCWHYRGDGFRHVVGAWRTSKGGNHIAVFQPHTAVRGISSWLWSSAATATTVFLLKPLPAQSVAGLCAPVLGGRQLPVGRDHVRPDLVHAHAPHHAWISLSDRRRQRGSATT